MYKNILLVTNLFLITKFQFFLATEFEYCFFVKAYNIEAESITTQILHSSRPIKCSYFVR